MSAIKVTGMHCGSCQKAVYNAVSALPGIKEVAVDLAKGEVSWKDPAGAPIQAEKVKEAVRQVGFEAV